VIVVDTSALIAILLKEHEAPRCKSAIAVDDNPKISAATLAEAAIVANGCKVSAGMAVLLGQLDLQVVPVTAATADQLAEAYRQWGKGNHPAGLNFDDCFAYALAKELGCPLLFIGNDFARTDVMRA
jgi:ribonuclease VapC